MENTAALKKKTALEATGNQQQGYDWGQTSETKFKFLPCLFLLGLALLWTVPHHVSGHRDQPALSPAAAMPTATPGHPQSPIAEQKDQGQNPSLLPIQLCCQSKYAAPQNVTFLIKPTPPSVTFIERNGFPAAALPREDAGGSAALPYPSCHTPHALDEPIQFCKMYCLINNFDVGN